MGSPLWAHPTPDVCTREIQKTSIVALGYFCSSFNTFVRGYFWPVLNKNRIYITLYTPLNPVFTTYFQEENREIDSLLKLHRSQGLNYAIIYKNFTTLENYK